MFFTRGFKLLTVTVHVHCITSTFTSEHWSEGLFSSRPHSAHCLPSSSLCLSLICAALHQHMLWPVNVSSFYFTAYLCLCSSPTLFQTHNKIPSKMFSPTSLLQTHHFNLPLLCPSPFTLSHPLIFEQKKSCKIGQRQVQLHSSSARFRCILCLYFGHLEEQLPCKAQSESAIWGQYVRMWPQILTKTNMGRISRAATLPDC